MDQVARKAVNAFATDAFTALGASGLYHRARPTYPVEAVSKLLAVLTGRKDASIVEVGAGTGIFTECLVNNKTVSETVAKITAIEPSSGMREAFLRNPLFRTPDRKPRVDIFDGGFAEIPVKDGSVDIIVGAQCFHWSHPDYSSSVEEFARILKPEGTLGLIWNLEDRNAAGWISQIRGAYEKYEQNTPQFRNYWWKAMFETSAYKACENFEDAEHFDFKVTHPTTRQQVVERVLSKSYISTESLEEQQKITRELEGILDVGQDRVWINEKEGTFASDSSQRYLAQIGAHGSMGESKLGAASDSVNSLSET
ncbi:MAG: hypothetical protein CYPHOPRED_003429 [Cyphobasidiales sp. Tagirdzhanova-0007]|nr:MAG: hypothetical protein CYPHOPRED_003429 [Cyphobasidiales sp. Tagirdzhanova-0007]